MYEFTQKFIKLVHRCLAGTYHVHRGFSHLITESAHHHMSVYLYFRLVMCRFSPKCPVTTRLFLLEAKASEVAIITIHSADCVSKSHHCNLRMSQVPSTTPSSCLRRRRTRHRCSTWRRTRAAPWASSSATTASTRSSSTTICPSRLSPTDR